MQTTRKALFVRHASVRKVMSLVLTLAMCASVLAIGITPVSVVMAEAAVTGLSNLPTSGTLSGYYQITSSGRTMNRCGKCGYKWYPGK